MVELVDVFISASTLPQHRLCRTAGCRAFLQQSFFNHEMSLARSGSNLKFRNGAAPPKPRCAWENSPQLP